MTTTKEFEPELSDEALINMVPPPKRKIREDTPLDNVSPRENYQIDNYNNREINVADLDPVHENQPIAPVARQE